VNVLIYGGGAVGLGIASCLIPAGANVDILARAATADALRKLGLERDGLFGRVALPPGAFGACASLGETQGTPYDFILVCTKSFDTRQAAEDLSRHPALRDGRTVFVLCQNGWGNAEEFVAHFPRECVYSARVITGFRRPAPHRVTITVHAEAIHVGSLFSADTAAVAELCRAVSAGGVPCQPTSEIGKDLWAKMLYNCALNPLGAVLRVPYGVLGQREDARAIMDAAVREVFAVMDACGYHTHWSDAAGFLEAFYARLVPSTAAHESSMLQDIRAGRRTEIDAMSGAVLRLAGPRGLAVPVNTVLYHLVKFAESASARPPAAT